MQIKINFDVFKQSIILSFITGVRKAEIFFNSISACSCLETWLDKVLSALGINISQINLQAQCIPKNGSLLISSNHPTGLADGMILLSAVLRVRADVKIVANDVLCHIDFIKKYIIPVNKKSGLSNIRTLLLIKRALKNNECVIVFPAGTVSHFQWRTLSIQDSPWNMSINKLANKLNVKNLKARIFLKNPLWFHLFAACSKHFRIYFLLRVFLSNTRYVDQPLKLA